MSTPEDDELDEDLVKHLDDGSADDEPYFEGTDLTRATLSDRKALLKRVLAHASHPLAFSSHSVGNGEVTPGWECGMPVGEMGMSESSSARGEARGYCEGWRVGA